MSISNTLYELRLYHGLFHDTFGLKLMNYYDIGKGFKLNNFRKDLKTPNDIVLRFWIKDKYGREGLIIMNAVYMAIYGPEKPFYWWWLNK